MHISNDILRSPRVTPDNLTPTINQVAAQFEELSAKVAGLFFDLHSPVQKELAASHGVTREAFIKWAESHCAMEPITIDGEVGGVFAINGDSLHVAVKPGLKGRWLRQLQRFIEKQGRDLVCMTAAADKDARRFIERAGCWCVGEDRNVARYAIKIDKLWFKEKRHGRNS